MRRSWRRFAKLLVPNKTVDCWLLVVIRDWSLSDIVNCWLLSIAAGRMTFLDQALARTMLRILR